MQSELLQSCTAFLQGSAGGKTGPGAREEAMAATRPVTSPGLSPVAACSPIQQEFTSEVPPARPRSGKAPAFVSNP